MASIGGALNPPSTINVNPSASGSILNVFSSISSLASGSETVIAEYTVPAGKKLYLQKIEASGENIAVYNVYLASSIEARRRTYFSGSLDVELEFSDRFGGGFELVASEKVEVKVIHSRSETADFDARILGVLVDV